MGAAAAAANSPATTDARCTDLVPALHPPDKRDELLEVELPGAVG